MTRYYYDMCSLPNYVTHAADTEAVNWAGGYPTYPITGVGGFDYGLDTGVGSFIDRDAASASSHLASAYFATSPTVGTFYIDRPAGQYLIGMAMGDPLAVQGPMTCIVKDGGTTLFTVTGTTSTANHFLDATSTELANADWEADNTPVMVTLSGTQFSFVIGSAAISPVNCIYIEPFVSGGIPIFQNFYRQQRV